MQTERHVRLFRNGRNQAVRISREFGFDAQEVVMRRFILCSSTETTAKEPEENLCRVIAGYGGKSGKPGHSLAQGGEFAYLQLDKIDGADRQKVKAAAQSLLPKLRDGRYTLERLRSMATVQAQMQEEIIKHLYTHLPGDAYAPQEIDAKAGALFSHIYSSRVHAGLVAYH